MPDRDDHTTDADRWSYTTGARFVGPDEWLTTLRKQWSRREMAMYPFSEALAAVADDDGTILRFEINEWYAGALSDVLRDEYDEPGWKLEYDRFTALALADIEHRLMFAGYLATRGNGDSMDLRLTLPSQEGAPR